MSSLYASNTLGCWSGLGAEAPIALWRQVALAAASLLPDGQRVLAQHGWGGLVEHVLGEAQFGARRYNMVPSRRLYYRLKPPIPRRATTLMRRYYKRHQEAESSLDWPIENRFVRFLHQVMSSPTAAPAAFWPGRAHYAFVLTHDVETSAGHSFVANVADLDERYGFRSSFNFVAG